MNSKRVFYVMIAAVAILFLAIIGSAYVANSLLQTQSTKLLALKLQSEVLDQEQTSLIKAKKDIQNYSSLEKIAKTIVPQDKDQARAVREIIKIANDSGISPSAITFPVSTLGGAGTKSVGAATPKTSAAKSALSQLNPVKDIKGVYVMKITITQDAADPVTYDKFIDFLSRLEQNRRTAQVSSIILQPSTTNRNQLSFTLTVDEFIKP
jgi:hypothetical protein